MTDILNDVEQAAVEAFYRNEGMRDSVKKVLLAVLNENGTLKPGVNSNPMVNAAFGMISQHPTLSDEQLGKDIRAKWEALCFIENAFNKMSQYVKVEQKPKEPNKAR